MKKKKKNINLTDLIKAQEFCSETAALGAIYINYLNSPTLDKLHKYIKQHPEDHYGLIRKLISHVGTYEKPIKDQSHDNITTNDTEAITDKELNQIAEKLFNSWKFHVDEKLKLSSLNSAAEAFSQLLLCMKDENQKRAKRVLDIATGTDVSKSVKAALNHSSQIESALKNLGVGPITELGHQLDKDYQSMMKQLGVPGIFAETAVGHYFEQTKLERQRLAESANSISIPLISQIEPNIAKLLNVESNGISANLFNDELARTATSIFKQLGLSAHQPWANALEAANSLSMNLIGEKISDWELASSKILETAEQAQHIFNKYDLRGEPDQIDDEDLDEMLEKHELPNIETVLNDPDVVITKADQSIRNLEMAPNKAKALGLQNLFNLIGILVGVAGIIDNRQTSKRLERVIGTMQKQNQIIAELVQNNEANPQTDIGQVKLENPEHRLHLRADGSLNSEIKEYIPNETIVVIIKSKNQWFEIKVKIGPDIITGWVLSSHISTFN